MLLTPTSSPKMTRMLGFFAAAGFCCACAAGGLVTPIATASTTMLRKSKCLAFIAMSPLFKRLVPRIRWMGSADDSFCPRRRAAATARSSPASSRRNHLPRQRLHLMVTHRLRRQPHHQPQAVGPVRVAGIVAARAVDRRRVHSLGVGVAPEALRVEQVLVQVP